MIGITKKFYRLSSRSRQKTPLNLSIKRFCVNIKILLSAFKKNKARLKTLRRAFSLAVPLKLQNFFCHSSKSNNFYALTQHSRDALRPKRRSGNRLGSERNLWKHHTGLQQPPALLKMTLSVSSSS